MDAARENFIEFCCPEIFKPYNFLIRFKGPDTENKIGFMDQGQLL